MPSKSDLHGSAPDQCSVALLIVDMINDFEFHNGQILFKNSLPVAQNILALKKRVKEYHIPVIYVNDNFGRWRSDINQLTEHCILNNTRGKAIVEILKPEARDYFVLKPKHSAFFHTSLDILLTYLHTKTIILTGVQSDSCILFSAGDAYMREYSLVIPSDCVTTIDMKSQQDAFSLMKNTLKADLSSSEYIDLHHLLHSSI